MRPFLRLSSLLLLLLAACSGPYKALRPAAASVPSAFQFKPGYDKKLYRCTVDGRFLFKKFHLSGLLLFKNMHDGSTRAVFQNEMGFTFFDFEWSERDSFSVNQIIPQLDKPALIRTLEKDMNLLLMKHLDSSSETVLMKGAETYHRFSLGNGFAYYITSGGQLRRIENAGKNKVVTIELSGKENDQAMPDTVFFNHHKANFTIRLQNIPDNADE